MVEAAEAAFVIGIDGDGESIAHDLSSRAGYAKDLTVVARRYLDENDSLISAVLGAADRVDGEYDPSKAYLADSDLNYAVNKLDEKLETLELSDADENYGGHHDGTLKAAAPPSATTATTPTSPTSTPPRFQNSPPTFLKSSPWSATPSTTHRG